MKPGMELDLEIAKKVMGIHYESYVHPDGSCDPYIPHYSTEIKYAWKVLEKINQNLSFEVKISRENVMGIRYDCTVWTDPDNFFNITSEISAPHAICMAALKSIGFPQEG